MIPNEEAIQYHIPFVDHREGEAAARAIQAGAIGGGGGWRDRVHEALRQRLEAACVIATTSCTHALEASLMALDIRPGDEVIVPAFTFPTTASCVLRQGADVVFADVRVRDLNIDPHDIARKITSRTKAIVVVHYGGVSCDMDAILALARNHGIRVIEDAAHALDSRYRGKACGTIGDIGCLSFHESKNVSCGEGGALITDDPELSRRLETICGMGTDKARMRRGEVDRYTWRELGSSYMPSDILMAVLSVQLEKADTILERRRELFGRYISGMLPLAERYGLQLPAVPSHCTTNGHIFFVILPSADLRRRCQSLCSAHGVPLLRHYEPLDRTPYGATLRNGRPPCPTAAIVSERLLRVPIHPSLSTGQQDYIMEILESAFRSLKIRSEPFAASVGRHTSAWEI